MSSATSYSAPELVGTTDLTEYGRHIKKHTNAVDMWALGVTIYVMLSGEYPPFDGFNGITAGGKTTWKYCETKTKEEKTLIQKLLNRDPKKRLTAAKVLKDAWLTGESPETRRRLTSFDQQRLKARQRR